MTDPSPDHLPVLAYHGVESPVQDSIGVTAKKLTEQLVALQERGWRLCGITEALASADPCVAVTFDDAYVNVMVAAELLLSLGASATIYVPSAHIGSPAGWLHRSPPVKVVDVGLLQEIVAGGFEIGSHSHEHRPLDELPPTEAKEQLRKSREVLQSLTHQPIASLAYPHGYWDLTTRSLARDVGFSSACALGHRVHRRTDDQLSVKRLLVTEADDADSLCKRVERTYPTLRGSVTTVLTPPWRALRRRRSVASR